jgi:hypothetical protein
MTFLCSLRLGTGWQTGIAVCHSRRVSMEARQMATAEKSTRRWVAYSCRWLVYIVCLLFASSCALHKESAVRPSQEKPSGCLLQMDMGVVDWWPTFSHDGSKVIVPYSNGFDDKTRVVEVASGSVIQEFDGYVLPLKDGMRYVCWHRPWDNENAICVVQPDVNGKFPRLRPLAAGVFAVSRSALLLAAGTGGQGTQHVVDIWTPCSEVTKDMERVERLHRDTGTAFCLRNLQFSPRDKFLAASFSCPAGPPSTPNDVVVVWEMGKDVQPKEVVPGSNLRDVAFAEKGRMLITTSWARPALKFWSLDSPSNALRQGETDQDAYGLAVSPDESLLAVGVMDSTQHIQF